MSKSGYKDKKFRKTLYDTTMGEFGSLAGERSVG